MLMSRMGFCLLELTFQTSTRHRHIPEMTGTTKTTPGLLQILMILYNPQKEDKRAFQKRTGSVKNRENGSPAEHLTVPSVKDTVQVGTRAAGSGWKVSGGNTTPPDVLLLTTISALRTSTRHQARSQLSGELNPTSTLC